jgi:hypothetical protein
MEISARDSLQIITVILCAAMLYGVRRRVKHYGEPARSWYVFLFIPVLSILFYILVFIDQSITDLFNASDASAIRNLAILIALVIYVYLTPHGTNGTNS